MHGLRAMNDMANTDKRLGAMLASANRNTMAFATCLKGIALLQRARLHRSRQNLLRAARAAESRAYFYYAEAMLPLMMAMMAISRCREPFYDAPVPAYTYIDARELMVLLLVYFRRRAAHLPLLEILMSIRACSSFIFIARFMFTHV